jgi:DNA primase
MSYQIGVKNIVASKGTALTVDQIDLIKRYCDTISLCFDTDLAGDAAARRGIEIADKAGLNIKIIQPEGVKDPAELCLKDPKLWEDAVASAIPIYDYYLQSAERRLNPRQASGKKAIFAELAPIWKKISDPLTKEHYIQKLAALLQTKDELLRDQLDNLPTNISVESIQPANQSKAPTPKAEPQQYDRRKLLEHYLLSLMLHIPSVKTYVPNFSESLLTEEELKQIYVLLVIFLDSISFKAKSFKIEEFVKTLPQELIPVVDRLYLQEVDEKLEDEKAWDKEVDMVVNELKKMLIKSSLEKLSLQIKNAQEFDKIEILEVLNKRFRDLSVKLKNL